MDSSPAFDPTVFDTLRASVDDDTAFLVELVNDYLHDAQELLDTMRSAVDNEDQSLLERAAHSLKSTSKTVGALALADVCATIERHAHDGHVHDAAHRLPDARACFNAAKGPLTSRKSTLHVE